jgi:hypothetical protein
MAFRNRGVPKSHAKLLQVRQNFVCPLRDKFLKATAAWLARH